jgi:hypothetical protein
MLAHACRSRKNQTVGKASFTQFRAKPIDDLVIADDESKFMVD